MKKKSLQLNRTDFVSHELKTPLSTLKLSVDLLKKQASKEQKKWLNIMEEEINWMIQFISDTLDLSRAHQKATFRPRRHNWNAWFFNLKNSFEKQAKLLNAPMSWSYLKTSSQTKGPKELSSDLSALKEEELEVLIDPLYMRQALLNLIMNAIEYSPTNSRVDVSWQKTTKQHLQIQVTDEGEGIAKTDLNKIFEPFQKSRSTLSKKIKGSGLGLSITKAIITAHGGDIHVQNRPESQGAVWTITLPLCS